MQHSTLVAETKIRSRERKRKDEEDIKDNEPLTSIKNALPHAVMWRGFMRLQTGHCG
ncbi:hypothetical protein [Pseudomonas arsenicoxydans]|uniref:hypothetical protein n=1 Tax=Pseudomonas arsenicoxydans TaxID=702115 RepID=UPI001ABFC8B3|nr:hypothetical protein [Pseudomonas arsenicoxydans]